MEDNMKKYTLLMTGLLTLSLSACGATTGGLAKSLAKQAAIQSASAPASISPTSVTTQLPAVDHNMDCAGLSTELADVDALINTSNKTIAGSGRANVAGKIAATGASQAALRSGATSALSKIPFGGLFAKKAMDTAANTEVKKVQQAQANLQSANLRKATLSGLYAGKNCAS
jgi:hypothetical protein